MKNPIINRQHIFEYIIFGLIACLLYMVPVWFFLGSNRFENLYLLYLGCVLFMGAIAGYGYKLLRRSYDKNRAASMLISSTLTTFSGVIWAVIMVIISTLSFFPQLFQSMPDGEVMLNAPATNPTNKPSGLLLMILATATLGNFSVGSFISVVVTYVGKLDQTKDKPAPLDDHIQPSEAA